MTVTSDFIPVTSPLFPHVSSSYHHCALLIMFLILLVLAQCKTGFSACSFTLYLCRFFSPSPKPHSCSTISNHCIFCIIFPFSPFCFPLSAPCCTPAMFPYCLSTPVLSSSSFPSLSSPQIQFDSHSLPGLNHQDLLVRPNHGPVSPQRGFCLLTVETNNLHALCLLSAHQHLEAVQVIRAACSTRRVTAHGRSLRLHLPVRPALF